jgi:hypothetical protein
MAADEQQALLLEALEQANGAVSFERLREIGVEYPASVVCELELTGLPLERCFAGDPSAQRVTGVRFDPTFVSADGDCAEPAVGVGPDALASARANTRAPLARGDAPAALAAVWGRVCVALARLREQARLAMRAGDRARAQAASRLRRGALPYRARRHALRALSRGHIWWNEIRMRAACLLLRGRQSPRRWLAPAALLAAAVAFAGLAIGELAGSGANTHATARGAHTRTRARAVARRAAQQPSKPAPVATSVPVSAPLASELEARGHALLEAGATAAAVPVLQQALAASGQRLADCLQPASESCLNYAYALYDLGRALLLAHEPAAAVLVLERRLQIANQQPVVQSELALARAAAGQRGA